MLRRAIELNPNMADAYLSLGNTLKELGKVNEAEDYIDKHRQRKVAVMNFGRLNPPTRGHYKLLEYIADHAKLLGGKGFIFLSASQNYLQTHKGTKWRPVVNRVTKSTFSSNKSNEKACRDFF